MTSLRDTAKTNAWAEGQAPRAVPIVLTAVVAGSWMYVSLVASRMGVMSSALSMPMTPAWSPVQVVVMVAMWVVMMVAMMLPSAVPMVLAYDRLVRSSSSVVAGSSSAFVGGYVAVWSAFAAAATGLQWALHSMALVNGMGEATQGWLAGSLLVIAGAFQFTPVKRRSLGTCRTPAGFLLTSWRPGASGALKMGVHHGVVCFRCCWAVMLLLFVLGVMNLVWVALLASFVLAEKLTRRGDIVSLVGGVVMVVWGIAVIYGG